MVHEEEEHGQNYTGNLDSPLDLYSTCKAGLTPGQIMQPLTVTAKLLYWPANALSIMLPCLLVHGQDQGVAFLTPEAYWVVGVSPYLHRQSAHAG